LLVLFIAGSAETDALGEVETRTVI